MSVDIRVFLAISLGSAALAFLARPQRRLSAVIGLVGLAASIVTALFLDGNAIVELVGGTLAGTPYLGWFLVVAGAGALGTSLVALAVDRSADLPALALTSLAASALALALDAHSIALVAATGAGALAVVAVPRSPSVPAGGEAALGLLHAVALAGALAIVAAAWLEAPGGALLFDTTAGGAAVLAMGLALAIRLGAIPFHRPNASTVQALAPLGLPIVLAWLPILVFLVALTWSQRVVQPQGVELGSIPLLIGIVGAASLPLGALGSLVRPAESDDLQHLVSYTIVQDAGLFLLAFSSFDPAAWEPGRAWALYFVASKTALAAWMAALVAVHGSATADRLNGWARRSPLLAVALMGAVAAGFGIPGLGSWDARAAIIEAVPEPGLRWVALAGWALAYVPFLRLLLWVGLRRAKEPPEGVERPRLRLPGPPPTARSVRAYARYAMEAARLSRLAIVVVLACAIGLGSAALTLAPGVRESAATLPEPLLPGATPFP